MSSLYELSTQFRATAERLADMDLPPEVVRDTLEGCAGELETKVQSVVCVARNLEALADSIDAAIKDMQSRAKTARARAEYLRRYTMESMQHAGIEKVECPLFKISVRTNPEAVDVFDAQQVPAEFLRQPEPPPPAIDKAAVKKALQSGADVPGARLARGSRLEVR